MTFFLLSTCSWCVVRASTWWLYDSLSSPPVAGVWRAHPLDWLYDSSLLSTCSWCVASAFHLIGSMSSLSSPPVAGVWRAQHLIGSMTLLSSPPVAGVWWAHTLDWLHDSRSLSTCSWGVVRAYTWLAPWLLSSLSTCCWCLGERIHLIGSMTLSPLHL